MTSYKARVIFVIISIVCISCHSKKKYNTSDALFQLLPAAQTGITFSNIVSDDEDINIFNHRNYYNGAGVAIGDVNNDGKPDIFFTSNQGSNKLYINNGNWKFDDVTEKAGLKGLNRWHTGVSMVDINGDGWLDIYVCNSGGLKTTHYDNELYINQKDGTFKEEAVKYGLNDKGLSTQAIFFDYDHDGDLDCFVLNNSYRPIGSFGYNRNLRNIRDTQNGDRLYRNDNGKFVDVSAQANIYGSEIGFGLGIAAGDLNNSGWDDMYVSNDFFEHDYLYINQHNGTFKDNSNNAMGHMSMSSMGSDMADINNDGFLDVFTTDMLPENDYRLKTTTKFDEFDVYSAKLQNDYQHQITSNCLQLNNGDGTFSEIAALAGINATDWSWGALCFDFDNDGWKDIYVSNGISKDLTNQDFLSYFSSEEVLNQVKKGGFKMKQFLDKMPITPIPNYGFVNLHGLQFKNETEKLGLGTPTFSNGAAYGDLDGDGDIDLVVNNENGEAFIYRNTTAERKTGNRYLKVQLKGTGMNTFGIGAKVTCYAKGTQQLIEQMPVRGFESSSEPVLNFGNGKFKNFDSLKVIWPDMKMQVLKNVSTNATITLRQSNALLTFVPAINRAKPYYQNTTATALKGDIYHKENNYKDFDDQRLIPKMLSTEGPKLAIADVNGDGLDDFFMGGAINDTAKLFVQQPNGNFVQKKEFVFEQDKYSEDIGALFFDADHDGDQDLVVASGGNQEKIGSLNLLVRMYINDGKGNFIRKYQGWPLVSVNASCVRLNSNGDLFIGARSIPGTYGVAPASKLLRNDGQGNFTDVTQTVAPQLETLGMVTDAQWVDIDGSGKNALVIVGDWMPVTIMKYVNGKLIKTGEIANSVGWWNCLTVADLNNDGKPDLVAGNAGLNSKIQADLNHPAKLYVADFDNNGQVECIPVYYKTDGKAYPFNLHDDLIRQMPLLKKKILRYDAYAGKSIDEIFPAADLEKATVLTVTQTQTCVFYNKGKSVFSMAPLPLRAQFSPVYGLLATDINSDGIPDLILGGNFYGLKPEVGRYDASYGVTLLGTSKYSFNYLPPTNSGIFIKGEVRDIGTINTKNGKEIIIARNNDALQIFKPLKKQGN